MLPTGAKVLLKCIKILGNLYGENAAEVRVISRRE